MNKDFLQRIASSPLVFDGAMGTMIYQKGVFVNVCYDELCLSRPSLIAEIHRDYVSAGADVIETNTFGANRIKLAEFGLAERLAEINAAGVALARQEAGDGVFVAGACGPCSVRGAGLDTRIGIVEDVFAEQAGHLAKAGADVIILETFHDVEELLLAARAARRSGLPVVASVSPAAFETTPLGTVLGRLDASPDVDVVGINCHYGPAEMLEPVRQARAVVRKPLIVMPNAGGPHEVGGRSLYLTSPEYFTEYAKKHIELGVNGVGGCCGTTPDHVRMAARAVHVLSGVKRHVDIQTVDMPAQAAKSEAVPFGEKSSFAEKLAKGRRVTSVEILPPRSIQGLDGFLEKCRSCEGAGVDAVNLPDGPRASARMSVIATAFAMRTAGLAIEPIPHCCCRDRNLIGLQSDILGGAGLGLKTWLFITGDPPKLGNYPDAAGVFDVDAVGLVRLCANLNRGFDAAAQPLDGPVPFVMGVGLNPVAVDLDREIAHFEAKVAAGAEYAITQPVFDVEALLRFLDRLEKRSLLIPIVIGVYPLLSAKNADFMNQYVPGVHVPDFIIEKLRKCKAKEDAIATGVAIARDTLTRLDSAPIAGFQVSAPLGRTDIALEVLG
ncbi:MAG: bifunctional homocysteine S-methyltransferase/methylenetetrahydrofolate reductase [Kiritimatiellia bacterium]|jgi:methionine synthase I (cobalamin-dependent)/5,10-methylenetetrahydrofolate reductase